MSIMPTDRKILVVDDDSDSLAIITEALSWQGYLVYKAYSGPEAIKLMAECKPDLIILDINMPGMDGRQTLKDLRDMEKYVSVMFISGHSSPEDIVEGLDSGADDYISKPFDPRELLARVRTQLRIKDLNDQLRAANAKLTELVDTDDLTGLFNMRSLYQRLEQELDRSRRFQRPLSVVMMDMDYFKTVNDGHDHLFGSYVLSVVGHLIKQSIRNIDLGARYGGDEFLILLTETGEEGAQIFCERLRKKIEETLFENGLDKIRLTASFGFSVIDPNDRLGDLQSSALNLVKTADAALYDAKRSGRNCVRSRSFRPKKIAS
jgi:two-component system, cell cycle response regulator